MPGSFSRSRKFDRLCGQIRELADQLGPDAKLPTMLQLRDSLGASVATLSSALGALEASNVIYRRHGVGIYVSPRHRQKAISLVCDPDFIRGSGASPFWDLMVDWARRRAAAREEAFSFHLGRPDGYPGLPFQDALATDIQAGRVDGVLCLGLGPDAAEWLAAQNVPAVVFAGAARWMVNLDSDEGVRLGVAALAAAGARRLGYWGHSRPQRSGEEPPTGLGHGARVFRKALAAAGLDFEEALVVENRDRVHLTKQEQGYHAAREVFEGPAGQRPDAVFIGDDLVAQGALQALQKRGVVVGRDVEIATHANAGSPVLLGHEDAVTLIEVDPAEVVGEMFAMLETLMAGRTPDRPSVLVKPRVRRRSR